MRKTAFWALAVLLLGGLGSLMVLLNPAFLYARQESYGQVMVLHDSLFTASTEKPVLEALDRIKQMEIYDPEARIDLCLGGASVYPALIRQLSGPAFGASVLNKAVLFGDLVELDFSTGQAKWGAREWPLPAVMAHELVHCFQQRAFGPLFPKRTGRWIAEGYAEYISRDMPGIYNLRSLASVYFDARKRGAGNWIELGPGEGSPTSYLRYRLLIQFCMEIELQSYREIASLQQDEAVVMRRFTAWYQAEPTI